MDEKQIKKNWFDRNQTQTLTIHEYIYIYICMEREREREPAQGVIDLEMVAILYPKENLKSIEKIKNQLLFIREITQQWPRKIDARTSSSKGSAWN